MPTNTNAYNSRVTDEALEKRFRDTFRAQGGAELVDDLYAQGVIVPVVDFTAAATGDTLSIELQQAWDFSTGSNSISNTTATLVSNAGFWKVFYSGSFTHDPGSSSGQEFKYAITDGITSKTIIAVPNNSNTVTDNDVAYGEFIVFLRSGDSLTVQSTNTGCRIDSAYRQVATVSGDIVNPSGFTSS